jgi:hypothetical protein
MNPPELCPDMPLEDAVLFALGLTDLELDQPSDHARKLIGLIALDHLEYSEQWRVSAMLRTELKQRWPELNL